MTDIGYDPVLKEAVAEIKAILKKHDIGGLVLLSSKTHSEFRLELPQWSCAHFTEGGYGIRMKCKKEDFPDRESQRVALEQTMHLLLSTRDMSGSWYKNLNRLAEMVMEKVEIEHEPFKNFKKHEDQ